MKNSIISQEGKKKVLEGGRKMCEEMHERHPGIGQESSTEHPGPQALQPRRKPWRISLDTEFGVRFSF